MISEERIDEIGEPFGYFHYGDSQGDKRLAFARAIEAEVAAPLKAMIKQLEQENATLALQNKRSREALLKLACLGNGEQYGNSVGNCIAQDALSLPDLSTSIIKHDNDVIERCAKVVDSLYDESEPWMCGDDLR